MRDLVRSKFRVKIKSLAEEARIIRKEEQRFDGQSSDRGVLRHHRITVVRDEQRATLLAYAYLKGVPYSVIESRSRKQIDTKAVCRILRSLSWCSVEPDKIGEWQLAKVS